MWTHQILQAAPVTVHIIRPCESYTDRVLWTHQNLQAAQVTVHIFVSINHTSKNFRQFHILQMIIRSTKVLRNCEPPDDGQWDPKYVVYVYWNIIVILTKCVHFTGLTF